jgi:hypothetical protein
MKKDWDMKKEAEQTNSKMFKEALLVAFLSCPSDALLLPVKMSSNQCEFRFFFDFSWYT